MDDFLRQKVLVPHVISIVVQIEAGLSLTALSISLVSLAYQHLW